MLLLLGLIDLLCALSLLLLAIGYPLYSLQAGAALLLGLKSLLFIKDFFSMIDILIMLVMFVLIWVQTPLIAVFLACYLAIKGIYSML